MFKEGIAAQTSIDIVEMQMEEYLEIDAQEMMKICKREILGEIMSRERSLSSI